MANFMDIATLAAGLIGTAIIIKEISKLKPKKKPIPVPVAKKVKDRK